MCHSYEREYDTMQLTPLFVLAIRRVGKKNGAFPFLSYDVDPGRGCIPDCMWLVGRLESCGDGSLGTTYVGKLLWDGMKSGWPEADHLPYGSTRDRGFVHFGYYGNGRFVSLLFLNMAKESKYSWLVLM